LNQKPHFRASVQRFENRRVEKAVPQMPYFTIATVEQIATQVLIGTGLSATAANATTKLLRDSAIEQLDPVPEEPAAKPTVLFDILLLIESFSLWLFFDRSSFNPRPVLVT
jgi:hypothetical protein